MDRREAIKRTSYLLGAGISVSALAGVLNGCQAELKADWQPVFLTQEEAVLVTAITARIIPSGKTPGAKEVGVPQFIDLMLNEYYLEPEQMHFRSGLKRLEVESQSILKKSFVNGTGEEQDQVLSEIAEGARRQLQKVKDEDRDKDKLTPKPFFLMIKELTLLGFFTSKVGATEVLQYDDIPGGFQGCMPLETINGKTWAT